ncbi:MAG: PAS domain S-box protein [Methanoregula sp.]|nr:PAS domain S-box protein [Methanoregula sp.]
MLSILYVDDEPVLLEIAKLFLERTGQFAVQTCASPTKAKEILAANRYDAIISDYQMPEMDGIEFLKYVREHHGHIPFILFTGRGREEVVIQALENGADFYLQKGGDPKAQFAELQNKLEKAVSEKRAVAAQGDSERRLTDIINFLPDATLAIDTHGTVIAWNRAMEQMTGVPAGEIIGKGNYEHALPFYHERRPILLDLILNYDQTIADAYDSIQSDGSNMISEKFIPFLYGGKGAHLWFVASPFYDANGNRAGAIESIRDVTPRKKLELSLRSSKRQYQNIFESAADAMLVVDRDSGCILDANTVATRLYGYTRDEFRSLKSRNLTDDGERMITSGQEGFFDIPERLHRKKDGVVFPAEIAGNIYPQKKRTIAIFTVRDITGRKEAERERDQRNDELNAANEQLAAAAEELRQNCEELGNNQRQLTQSNDFLTSVITASPFAIVAFDANGIIRRWNAAAERLFDWSASDMIGNPLPRTILERWPEYNAIQQRVYSGETISGIELLRVTKRGVMIDISLSAAPIYYDSETVTGVLLIIEDITEKKAAVQALAENRRVLDTLIDNLPGMVYRCRNDPDWTMEFVSGGCLDLTGYVSEDLVRNHNVSYGSLIIPEDRQRVSDEVQKGVSLHQPFQMEYRITDQAGQVRWVWEQGRGVFNDEGVFVALEGYITNNSEHKRAEDALRQANKKLNLLSGITRHDIKNQLFSLKAFLEISKEHIRDPEEVFRLIEKKEKIVDTLEQQIDVTREYGDIGVNEPVWQDIGAVFTTALKSWPMSGITVEAETGDYEVFADPLLERVFFNLIDNSLRHGEKVSCIRFFSTAQKNELVVVYEDDGTGIPEADKPFIFDHGFGKNTGLGLYLSREILSITGITITENGEPGKGARFVIAVPQGQYRLIPPAT